MNWLSLVSLSLLLGVGLAIDAFSVSIANAIAFPKMKKGEMNAIALCFAFFQTAMPLIGWLCIHTIATYFTAFQKAIPYIALVLLLYLGGKMVFEAIRGGEEEEEEVLTKLTLGTLAVQGIATSIDALSVGFAISDYTLLEAIISSLIIGVTTFFICSVGLVLGRKVGEKLESRATIFGGLILIAIGIEIFVKGVFF